MEHGKFIVTGGAGFIGANILSKLNEIDVTDILVTDNLRQDGKWDKSRG